MCERVLLDLYTQNFLPESNLRETIHSSFLGFYVISDRVSSLNPEAV